MELVDKGKNIIFTADEILSSIYVSEKKQRADVLMDKEAEVFYRTEKIMSEHPLFGDKSVFPLNEVFTFLVENPLIINNKRTLLHQVRNSFNEIVQFPINLNVDDSPLILRIFEQRYKNNVNKWNDIMKDTQSILKDYGYNEFDLNNIVSTVTISYLIIAKLATGKFHLTQLWDIQDSPSGIKKMFIDLKRLSTANSIDQSLIVMSLVRSAADYVTTYVAKSFTIEALNRLYKEDPSSLKNYLLLPALKEKIKNPNYEFSYDIKSFSAKAVSDKVINCQYYDEELDDISYLLKEIAGKIK